MVLSHPDSDNEQYGRKIESHNTLKYLHRVHYDERVRVYSYAKLSEQILSRLY